MVTSAVDLDKARIELFKQYPKLLKTTNLIKHASVYETMQLDKGVRGVTESYNVENILIELYISYICYGEVAIYNHYGSLVVLDNNTWERVDDDFNNMVGIRAVKNYIFPNHSKFLSFDEIAYIKGWLPDNNVVSQLMLLVRTKNYTLDFDVESVAWIFGIAIDLLRDKAIENLRKAMLINFCLNDTLIPFFSENLVYLEKLLGLPEFVSLELSFENLHGENLCEIWDEDVKYQPFFWIKEE